MHRWQGNIHFARDLSLWFSYSGTNRLPLRDAGSVKFHDSAEHVSSDRNRRRLLSWLNDFCLDPSMPRVPVQGHNVRVRHVLLCKLTAQWIRNTHEKAKPPATSPQPTVSDWCTNSRTTERRRQGLHVRFWKQSRGANRRSARKVCVAVLHAHSAIAELP